MEIAYDHVQEAVIEAGDTTPKAGEAGASSSGAGGSGGAVSLNAEFEQAYKAISASPWGMRFGAFVGTVKKQSESYYEQAAKSTVTEQATRGFTDLKTNIINRTRSLSLTGVVAPVQELVTGKSSATAPAPPPSSGSESTATEKGAAESTIEKNGPGHSRSVSMGGDFISKLKANAAKRIEEIEKVEKQADEYLLKFGTTIGNFLKEAVTIAPPEGETFREGGEGEESVLFESKGGAGAGAAEDGKRQIYTTRLDAQLHLLHTSIDLFKLDPAVDSYKEWSTSFDIVKRTEQIATDLEKYPELRASMEKLVPDTVKYEDFWKRYYFLRAELDSEELKRKELLKGALEEEEVGWDEDSEDDEATETKATATKPAVTPTPAVTKPAVTRSTPPTTTTNVDEDDDEEDDEDEDDEDEDEDEDEDDDEDDDEDEDEDEEDSSSLKPPLKGPREQTSTETLQPQTKPKASLDRTSLPDSDTSYDIVSGAPSKTPSQTTGSPPTKKKDVDSDSGEDWE